MKLINKFFILAIIAISAIITGCESRDSDKILPENPIFQDYYVKYNKTKKQTEARATFRTIDKKGVRLVLKGKSNVKLNGKKCNEFTTAAIDGYFYRWDAIKGMVEAKFTYVKNGTKTFENIFKPKDAPKIDFKSGHESLNMKKDNKIVWQGSPLKSGETVFVFIFQNNKLRKTFATDKIGATSLIIKKNALKDKDLKAGKAEIHLIRRLVKNNINKTDKKAGGRITLVTLVSKETVIK